MSNTIKRMEEQLAGVYSEDAQNCIDIYNALKQHTGGVCSSDFNVLVSCGFIRVGNEYERVYKPTIVGNIFLNGIKNAKL